MWGRDLKVLKKQNVCFESICKKNLIGCISAGQYGTVVGVGSCRWWRDVWVRRAYVWIYEWERVSRTAGKETGKHVWIEDGTAFGSYVHRGVPESDSLGSSVFWFAGDISATNQISVSILTWRVYCTQFGLSWGHWKLQYCRKTSSSISYVYRYRPVFLPQPNPAKSTYQSTSLPTHLPYPILHFLFFLTILKTWRPMERSVCGAFAYLPQLFFDSFPREFTCLSTAYTRVQINQLPIAHTVD